MGLIFTLNSSRIEFGGATPINNLAEWTSWMWFKLQSAPGSGIFYDLMSKGFDKRVELLGEGGGIGTARITFTVTRSGTNNIAVVDILDSDLQSGVFLCCTYQNISSSNNRAGIYWAKKDGALFNSSFSTGSGNPTSDASDNLHFGRRVSANISAPLVVSYLGHVRRYLLPGEVEQIRQSPGVPVSGVAVLCDGLDGSVANRAGPLDPGLGFGVLTASPIGISFSSDQLPVLPWRGISNPSRSVPLAPNRRRVGILPGH